MRRIIFKMKNKNLLRDQHNFKLEEKFLIFIKHVEESNPVDQVMKKLVKFKKTKKVIGQFSHDLNIFTFDWEEKKHSTPKKTVELYF